MPKSSGRLFSRIQDVAVVLSYRTAAKLVARIPTPLASLGGRVLGRVLIRSMGPQRALVARHQARLSPELVTAGPAAMERRVAETFDSYAQYWVSMFRLQGQNQSQIDATIHVDGAQYIDAALHAGKGAIMAMPHIGAWDHGGAWLAGQWPLTVVAERLHPPALFQWFCEQRARNGMTVVALGDDEGGKKLIRALRNNEVIGLLCDRDIAGGGVEVTFFGETATMPAGPALLAIRTGAQILPNAVYQRPDGSAHGVIRPPLSFEPTGKLRTDIATLTQMLADELAQLIAVAPQQWHVLQPHWLSDTANSVG